MMGGSKLDMCGTAQRQVVGSYKHGNGPSGSIMSEKFLD